MLGVIGAYRGIVIVRTAAESESRAHSEHILQSGGGLSVYRESMGLVGGSHHWADKSLIRQLQIPGNGRTVSISVISTYLVLRTCLQIIPTGYVPTPPKLLENFPAVLHSSIRCLSAAAFSSSQALLRELLLPRPSSSKIVAFIYAP